jgi:5-methylcytosine-specific restriction enzyme A
MDTIRGSAVDGHMSVPVQVITREENKLLDKAGLQARMPAGADPTVEVLKIEIPRVSWDRLQGSGVQVSDGAAEQLHRLWSQYVDASPFRSPEEPAGEYPEGALRRVAVNRYERDRRARAACIAHHGTNCAVCGFDFETRYGKLGRGFIHVHHLTELSSVGSDYRVDPINDLRPICPNCHAMVHRVRPALSIRQLRKRLRSL